MTLWGAGIEGKSWRRVLAAEGLALRRWVEVDPTFGLAPADAARLRRAGEAPARLFKKGDNESAGAAKNGNGTNGNGANGHSKAAKCMSSYSKKNTARYAAPTLASARRNDLPTLTQSITFPSGSAMP